MHDGELGPATEVREGFHQKREITAKRSKSYLSVRASGGGSRQKEQQEQRPRTGSEDWKFEELSADGRARVSAVRARGRRQRRRGQGPDHATLQSCLVCFPSPPFPAPPPLTSVLNC